MITALVLIVLRMHIEITRLLEDGAPSAKWEADSRLRTESTGLGWDNNADIEEAIAADEDNKNEEKNPRR